MAGNFVLTKDNVLMSPKVAARTGKSECTGSTDLTLIANRIRILAIDCKSRDTLSCAFGNEFAPKVERYLRELFESNDNHEAEEPKEKR